MGEAVWTFAVGRVGRSVETLKIESEGGGVIHDNCRW